MNTLLCLSVNAGWFIMNTLLCLSVNAGWFIMNTLLCLSVDAGWFIMHTLLCLSVHACYSHQLFSKLSLSFVDNFINYYWNPFDEILSTVPYMELLSMPFCCKTENFTKSAQFWSQNVSLILTKKTIPTLYISDHKQQSYWSLKLPNHALFLPTLHNTLSFHK